MFANEQNRPDRSAHGKGILWCPFAKIVSDEMPTRGKYPKGYPEGAVVHYTGSGWGDEDIAYGRKMGYAFLFIAGDGSIYQSNPLDRWGYHAGESYLPSVGKWVSKRLVGIEVDSPGMLTRVGATCKTWYGTEVPTGMIRHVPNKDGNIAAGYYQMFTPAQEQSLMRLLLWLKQNNPVVFDVNNVVGHDEVSPGRKVDPGGCLSETMGSFRDRLKKHVAKGSYLAEV